MVGACTINRMSNFLLKTASKAARALPAPLRRGLYRLGPISGWIRRALNRAAPQGLTEIEVASGAIAGLKLRLDLQKEKDCWLGNYETNLQDAVAHFVKPGMIIYDVGANIGYVSLIFAAAVGKTGRVYSFEALPSNISRLQDHIKMNQFAERSTVRHAAVVDKPGAVEFLVHDSHGMGKAAGSAGRDEAYSEKLTVEGVSIDAFVFDDGHPAPQLLKMDIEGGEVMALPGMRRTLAVHRPVVFLELHGREAAESAWDIFTAEGYSLHEMEKGFPRVLSLADVDWKAYLIAIPQAGR